MSVEATEYRLVEDASIRGAYGNRRGDMIVTSVTVLDHDVRVEVWTGAGTEEQVRANDLRLDAAQARLLALRLLRLADLADASERMEANRGRKQIRRMS